jgi:KDO2-lipid IV(A) lauroyltransferase
VLSALKPRLLLGLLALSARLPLAHARALGSVIAALYWPLHGSSRRVTERNIAVAFAELDVLAQRQLARDSLKATAQLAAEMGHVWLRDWRALRPCIRAVQGEQQILAALAGGRGVVVLGPHLGNWEVLGLHLATLGPLVALYEPPHMRELDALIRAARQRSGATLVPTDQRGIAQLSRALRAGQIVGVLPDQVPPQLAAGQNSPFMGTPCFTGTLASKLIQRSGALAVFGYAQRVPDGFSVHYLPAEPEIYSSDMALSLAALNRGVEHCLRQCPEQYQWEYKRFRQRPAQGVDIYRR